MKIIRKYIPVFMLVLTVHCMEIKAQAVAGRLDSLFTAPGNFENLNGNVLIAENGKIIYQRSFGFANFEKKKPNDKASSFNIGSNTKTFTSTAILQLKGKGKLRLDDPFKKYFPLFPYPSITIHHLLTHTSGLSDFDMYFAVLKDEPNKILTNEDIIPSIIKYNKPLKFQPGDDFNYCNTNFELLALLVEKISGLTYPDYLKKFIFLPAGMLHSYTQNDPQKTRDSNLVINYMPANLYSGSYTNTDSTPRPMLKQIVYNLGGLIGDGGIISTVQDMLHYDNALYNGKLLKTSTLEEAYTPMRLNTGKDYHMFKDLQLGWIHYGLGWMVDVDSSMGRIISHGGHYPGLWSAFLRNTSKRQTIIIFDNTDWSGADLISRMALDILNNKPIVNVLKKKSLASVYGQSLLVKDADIAFSKLVELKDDTVHYILRELDLNALGYQLQDGGYIKQALETFKVNTLLFPSSANVYDSYGDALAGRGEKDGAAIMYKKSSLLNPKNEAEKTKLKKLMEQN